MMIPIENFISPKFRESGMDCNPSSLDKILFNDIKEFGIKDPLICRFENHKYYIVDGAFRYYAAKTLGIKKLLVKIIKSD